MGSRGVQPTSLMELESTWVRGGEYMEQEAKFVLFDKEVSWKKEKQSMQNEIKKLESKVKDQQQQLQERKNIYEGNEKAFFDRETALLKKNAELNKELTEKREQETNGMKDLATLKSQVAKKENQFLPSEREHDEKFRADEKAKLGDEIKKLEDKIRKLEDENRELVMKVNRSQQDWSHTEIMLTTERDYLKMQLAANQKYSQQTSVFGRVQTVTTNSLKMEEQQAQLIDNNSKWQEKLNSCEKQILELKEIGQKEKLKFKEECSKKNDQIEKLQNRIFTLKEDFATEKQNYQEKINCELNQKQEIWAKEKSELQRDWSKNSETIEKQQNEIERLKRKIEKLQENLIIEQEKYSEKLKMQQEFLKQLEVKEVNYSIKKLQDEIDKLQHQNIAYEETFAKEQRKYLDLKKHQDILEKEKFEMKRDCARKDKELEKLKGKKDSLQGQIEELQETLATKQQEYHKKLDLQLKQQQEIWGIEKLGIDRDCARKDKELEQLKDKNNSLLGQTEELQEMLATKQQEYCKNLDSQLKHQRDIWEKEKFEIERHCAQKDKEFKKLEDKNYSLRGKIEELQEMLATEHQEYCKNLYSQLENQQEIWEKETSEIERDCAQKDKELEKLKDKNYSLQEQIKELRERLAIDQQQIWENEKLELEKDSSKNDQKIEMLQEKIDTQLNDIAELMETTDDEFKQREQIWIKEKEQLEKKLYKMNCQNEKIGETLELERRDMEKQQQAWIDKEDVWKTEKIRYENHIKEKTLAHEKTLRELQKRKTELMDLKKRHDICGACKMKRSDEERPPLKSIGATSVGRLSNEDSFGRQDDGFSEKRQKKSLRFWRFSRS
ncbi:uncharacterized protein [Eucyclogobius newberryi]|uniref:uncharacterized protein n=1 Tax=Eucyclogobius newberryi TaxID=166745 RepID=UPI003B59CBC8